VNCTGCGKRLRRHEQDNGLCDACDRLNDDGEDEGPRDLLAEFVLACALDCVEGR
jgi:hypothetical protein